MRHIFLDKSYTKSVGETILRHFSKKSKLNISLDHQLKALCNLFLFHAKLRVFTLIKLFKKTKKVLELVSLPRFLCEFWRKIPLWLCFIN